MAYRIPIKNHKNEIKLTKQRTIMCLIIIFILIGLLLTRLAYLQIHKHTIYSTLSKQNWLDLVPIEPTRGLIYDRNGILLAKNIPVFSLDLTPAKVNHLDQTLKKLRTIINITDNDLIQFRKQSKQHRRFDEIPLKLRLSEDELARFVENQYQFQGVAVKARLMRDYPFKESFSHVLGYVGRINTAELAQIDQVNYSASHYIGKLGIEKFYEDELHGKVGYEEVENDAKGRSLRILNKRPGKPGKNLYLTIDSGLQFVAERAILNGRGAVVAIQPKTGQILAMVSQPGYDPNAFVLGINQKDYQALQQSPDRPLFDRTIRGLYPPASTVKPILALQGLATETISPNYSIYDPGYFQLPNVTRRFRDWKRYGHGRVDANRAIQVSCDTFFYQLGFRMGIRPIVAILNEFGFGHKTGINLPHELAGTVSSPEWKQKTYGTRWYDGDTINASIGQGSTQVTPLQLAYATTILANRGKRLKPTLLLGEQETGQAFQLHAPFELNSLDHIDQDYFELVIHAMQDVVDTPQGTAYRYGHKRPYTIAAKTGTAQVRAKPKGMLDLEKQESLPERFRDHHIFIAFAPVDDPQIALAVISENSNYALEAAKMIIDYYLMCAQDKLNIPQDSLLVKPYQGKCQVLKNALAYNSGIMRDANLSTSISL